MQRPTNAADREAPPNLNALLAEYGRPDLRRSLWQLCNTAVPFALLWTLMYGALVGGHYGATLLLALPAGGLMLRLFILQHDCGHGAFFKSARANDALGTVLGVLTLTPYHYWRRTHAVHHSTSGNLDRRGYGDITTLTVKEYARLSAWERWKYRVYRSPLILFGVGPAFHFIVYHRLPPIVPASWKQERYSILGTNLALAVVLLIASATMGLRNFLMVELPIVLVAVSAGVWFFYVQHQFEDAYWVREQDWEFAQAGMKGSSFYKLPRVLQWITGNIGFHHIHHLNSRIPNYYLEKCMKENAVLQDVPHMTFWQSFKCVPHALWDEDKGKMVSFDDVLSYTTVA